jgi:hypothetical protein
MKKATIFFALAFVASMVLSACGDHHCEAYHAKAVKTKADRTEAAI